MKKTITDQLSLGWFWVSGLLILVILLAIILYLIWRGGHLSAANLFWTAPTEFPWALKGGYSQL